MKGELKIGDAVFITDQKHPWIGKFGRVISGIETYGLGWKGNRVELEGNHGETYVTREQVMAHGLAASIVFCVFGKRKSHTKEA